MDPLVDQKSIAEILAVAERVAREAGQILLDKWSSRVVSEKGPQDLVTDADVAAQQWIHRSLGNHYPEFEFVGEEQPERMAHRDPTKLCWLVDPLDGTVNFVHGFPAFAVSIALIQDKEPIIGVVYDPFANEMFSAAVGQASTLNGVAIRSSQCTSLSQAMVAVSFPLNVRRQDPAVLQFLEVLERSRTIRRMGSASLNLCYVACGRMDAYWTDSVHPWDVAAGALIARNSETFVSGLHHPRFNVWSPSILVAGTEQLAMELGSLCKEFPSTLVNH